MSTEWAWRCEPCDAESGGGVPAEYKPVLAGLAAVANLGHEVPWVNICQAGVDPEWLNAHAGAGHKVDLINEYGDREPIGILSWQPGPLSPAAIARDLGASSDTP